MMKKPKALSFYLDDATTELLFAMYTKRVQENLKNRDVYKKVSRSCIVNEAIRMLAQKELP